MPTTALITGGAGSIATSVRPFLRGAGWRLRLLDVVEALDPQPGERVIVGSFLDDAVLAEASAGVDLVVHLGAHPIEMPWERILELNIDGTRRVFEAARAAGVPRVLFASSIHAIGFEGFDDLRRADALLPRPDSYYGVSKATGEALGALYADRFGMTVVSARIFNAGPRFTTPYARVTWLSPADAARLILAVGALDEPGHRIVWGVSKGGERVFPLEPGRRIGFDPQDDCTEPGDVDTEPPATIGGEFTELPLGEQWWH